MIKGWHCKADFLDISRYGPARTDVIPGVCHIVLHDHDDVIKNGNIFSVTGPLCGEFTGHR